MEFEGSLMQNNNSFSLDNKASGSDADKGASNNGFECNICLDSVQDPVVTLCGHLFCWPCIYKWLHYSHNLSQFQTENCRCPVCKAEISHASLIPLYGRFQTTNPSKTKSSNLDLAIPRRPLGRRPACGAESPTFPRPELHPQINYSPHHQSHSSYYPQTHDYIASSVFNSSSITTNIIHPVIGMFDSRTFGNTTTNVYAYQNSYGHVSNISARLRRHLMQADESLSRICFFLFCCLVMCLLLF